MPFGKGAHTRLLSTTLGGLLRELSVDVLHVHGLDSPRQVLALADLEPSTPIVLQDHASRLPRFWRRAVLRRSTAVAAGIAFCALEQAQPFIRSGLVDSKTQIYEIAESTCRFVPGEQEAARRDTAVEGDPAILWVGHLDANKDPLTVLEGLSIAVRHLPDLKLYCCFGSAPLLRAVRKRINADPRLRGRVRLLGRVPHDRIELLMRAADLFVLGSHHEGSGYSLIEALACGLPPVVTDIPSFRTLTGEGRAGALWPCGDPRALSDAVQAIWTQSRSALRCSVRAHFERELSFHALGFKLSAMYEHVVQRNCNSLAATRSQELDGPILDS